MYDIRKKTVEKRNSRGDIVKKVVTLTKKFHDSTKPKGKKSHGSTKPKGNKQQMPPSDDHLQPTKYPLLPPPTQFPLLHAPSTMFPGSMHHPMVPGNRGEIFRRQEFGVQNFNSTQCFSGSSNNQGYGKYNTKSFKGQDNEEYGMQNFNSSSHISNNQEYGMQNFSSQSFSQSSNNRGAYKAAFGMPKANVTTYSDAEGSDAEGSDAMESEAENIISSEESEAESEAEDTNSEESEAETEVETETEIETEVETETEIESEAENTNSEESEAEDSDDEPPRRAVNINRAMRNLSMQRQDRRKYNFW